MRPRYLSLLTALLALLVAACEAPERPAEVRPTSTFVPARPLEPAPQASSGVIERLGLSVRASAHGLVVVALDLDGPAAQAGTLIGDVVVAVNGAAPGDVPGLQRLVKAAPGVIQLELRRRGAAHQVAIRAGDPAQAAESAGTWTAFGLQVKDLPDAARKALGVTSGVIVTRIRAPADRTRLLPGDVIVAIDRQAVQSAEEFLRLAERAAERRSAAVGLLVKRADADLFIPVESGEVRAGTNGAGDASRGGGAPRLEERYRRRGPTGTPLRT